MDDLIAQREQRAAAEVAAGSAAPRAPRYPSQLALLYKAPGASALVRNFIIVKTSKRLDVLAFHSCGILHTL